MWRRRRHTGSSNTLGTMFAQVLALVPAQRMWPLTTRQIVVRMETVLVANMKFMDAVTIRTVSWCSSVRWG